MGGGGVGDSDAHATGAEQEMRVVRKRLVWARARSGHLKKKNATKLQVAGASATVPFFACAPARVHLQMASAATTPAPSVPMPGAAQPLFMFPMPVMCPMGPMGPMVFMMPVDMSSASKRARCDETTASPMPSFPWTSFYKQAPAQTQTTTTLPPQTQPPQTTTTPQPKPAKSEPLTEAQVAEFDAQLRSFYAECERVIDMAEARGRLRQAGALPICKQRRGTLQQPRNFRLLRREWPNFEVFKSMTREQMKQLPFYQQWRQMCREGKLRTYAPELRETTLVHPIAVGTGLVFIIDLDKMWRRAYQRINYIETQAKKA